jgi:hypothetical protein
VLGQLPEEQGVRHDDFFGGPKPFGQGGNAGTLVWARILGGLASSRPIR